jgi:RNA-splicing ligase RtcB
MADLKIFADSIETSAYEQIQTLIKQPAFSDCKVRIMPDVHAGAGCVIGFTADLGDKVIPNVVGVDIGCGMLTVELGKIDIDFEKLDSVIRNHIPAGMNVREDYSPCSLFLTKKAKGIIHNLYCSHNLKNISWLESSMGSLGGGNHFIEIDVDDEGNKYLIIHTGSRNLGKQVADIYQRMANDTCCSQGNIKDLKEGLIQKLKGEGREQEIEKELRKLKIKTLVKPPKDLCYLTGKDRDYYLYDMRRCQEFAMENRTAIGITILRHMHWSSEGYFHTVHNYIGDDNIVRKGAISAKKGERLLIPINMKDGCILGVGKGNPDWNYSAPHGAGRIMSRREARDTISMDDYKNSMDGIFTTSVDESTIDESPMAYKPIEQIVSNIGPTVEIQKIIKPIYNFKAGE